MPMLSTIKVSRPTLLAMDKVLRAAKASPKAKAREKTKAKEKKEAKAVENPSTSPSPLLPVCVASIGNQAHVLRSNRASVHMITLTVSYTHLTLPTILLV